MNRKVAALSVAIACGLLACDGESTVPVPPAEPPTAPDPPATSPPPPPAADTGPWRLDATRGQQLFGELCQRCHGPQASGGYGPTLNNPATCGPCGGFTTLWQRIDGFMPLRNPEQCDKACARDIAAWISNGFSPAASCSVEYRYGRITPEGFTAGITIRNFRGLPVPSWRLAFTLPAGHAITGVVDALSSRSGDEVLLQSYGNQGIADGSEWHITLQGTQAGIATVPSDLRLEAPPCFTTPPA